MGKGKVPRPRDSQALLAVVACLMLVGTTGCGRSGQRGTTPFGRPRRDAAVEPAGQPAVQQPQAQQDGQQEILAAQRDHKRKVELTVSGRVAKMLPDDTRGLPHERFLLQLDNGTRVLVAHDTKMAPRVPLSDGDFVRIHGEYIWNEKGGVLHWTHHAANGRHEPGWIEYNGQRYE